jgi:hypothetical protein
VLLPLPLWLMVDAATCNHSMLPRLQQHMRQCSPTSGALQKRC